MAFSLGLKPGYIVGQVGHGASIEWTYFARTNLCTNTKSKNQRVYN